MIEAIFRSRKIFQRMLNYCTYRISCTFQLLVFFFITMVSLQPKNYSCSGDGYDYDNLPKAFALPVICLVIITILNDGTIISIAYDRVTVSKSPEQWNLVFVFIKSTILGGIAFTSSIIVTLTELNNMEYGTHNEFSGRLELRTQLMESF